MRRLRKKPRKKAKIIQMFPTTLLPVQLGSLTMTVHIGNSGMTGVFIGIRTAVLPMIIISEVPMIFL